MPYATKDNVFTLALGAQAFVALARPFDAIDALSGVIRLKAHGLSDLDLVTLEVSDGGSLPPELSDFQIYRARPMSADLFRLASETEDPIPYFLDAGSGWSISVDPYRRLDCNLVDTAAFIDEHLTAHDPPILPDPMTGLYPPILVGLNARLAARQTVNSLQLDNAAYRVALDRLFDSEKRDMQLLADWKAGKPVQPRPTDQNQTADNAPRAGCSRPAIDWNRGYL